MSALDYILITLWAGAVGWMLRGIRLERKRDEVIHMEAGKTQITIPVSAIHAYLDRKGLIAVPKGADFQPQQDKTACK